MGARGLNRGRRSFFDTVSEALKLSEKLLTAESKEPV